MSANLSFRRYKHDCSECIPLGKYEEYDLYMHIDKGCANNLVARYGDEGHEYASILVGMAPYSNHDALREAYYRWYGTKPDVI